MPCNAPSRLSVRNSYLMYPTLVICFTLCHGHVFFFRLSLSNSYSRRILGISLSFRFPTCDPPPVASSSSSHITSRHLLHRVRFQMPILCRYRYRYRPTRCCTRTRRKETKTLREIYRGAEWERERNRESETVLITYTRRRSRKEDLHTYLVSNYSPYPNRGLSCSQVGKGNKKDPRTAGYA